MRKCEHVRSARDFAVARRFGKTARSDCLSLNWVALPQLHHRFGFIVSKRVGNAVVRNHIKRQMRAIFDAHSADIRPGFDIIVIVRPCVAQYRFQQLAAELCQLLQRAHLWLPTSSCEIPNS